MRRSGISVREIAHVLAVSIREVYRLLGSVAVALVWPTGGSSAPVVQGSPALSDFEGALGAVPAASECAESNEQAPVIDYVLASEPLTAHGGAIAAAIVSEYAVTARSAVLQSDTTSDGRGVRGETDAGESPIACIQRRIGEIIAKLREPERPP